MIIKNLFERNFYGILDREKFDNVMFSENKKSLEHNSLIERMIELDIYIDPSERLILDYPEDKPLNTIPAIVFSNGKKFILNPSLKYEVGTYFYPFFLRSNEDNALFEFTRINIKLELLKTVEEKIEYLNKLYDDLITPIIENDLVIDFLERDGILLESSFREKLEANNFSTYLYLTTDPNNTLLLSFEGIDSFENINFLTKNCSLILKIKDKIKELKSLDIDSSIIRLSRQSKKPKPLKELFDDKTKFEPLLKLLIKHNIVLKIDKGYEIVFPKEFLRTQSIYSCCLGIQLINKKYISFNNCSDDEVFNALNHFFSNVKVSKQNFSYANNPKRNLTKYLEWTDFLPMADNIL